jgi:hypothetical protein
MQRLSLVRNQTTIHLRLCDGIVADARTARPLQPLVPEIRSSAGVCAAGGETFGAVFDLGSAVAAEVGGVQDFAHCCLGGRRAVWPMGYDYGTGGLWGQCRDY